MHHEKSAIAEQSALDSICTCRRAYDPTDDGHGHSVAGAELFSAGETYPYRSSVEGWCEIEDNYGALHTMPNAAFASFFRAQ